MIAKFINILGTLLLVTGIMLKVNQKKQQKGERTWEGDHGIQIKTWHSVVSIILGIVIMFAGNAMQNIAEASSVNTEISQDSPKSNTGSDFASKILDKNRQEAQKESTFEASDFTNSLPTGDPVQPQQTPVQSLSSKGYSIKIGNITIYDIPLPDAWVKYSSENLIQCKPNDYVYVDYSDSYVKCGDTERVLSDQKSINEVWGVESEIREFEFGGTTAYAIAWQADEYRTVRIYQTVPDGTNYLKVEISDYTGTQDLASLIDLYCLDFTS